MFKKYTRADGSVVILAPKRDTKAITFQVVYKIGSRQESPAINGGSHFIEHLMFKGTKKRPNTLAISKELDSVGAKYNAYTSKDHTLYYVKADNSHLVLAIEVLADMLRHSKFDPKEVQKERGVILEEINMYEDNPIMHVEDLYESILYQGTPLGRMIIGTRANIRGDISRDKLFEHKNRWYYPGNMILGLTGNFSEKKALSLLNRFFPVEKKASQKAEIKHLKLIQFKPRVKVMFKETEQVQIMLGFPGLGMGHKDLSTLLVMANILGGSMSSRLFINIREKRGLCYFIRASLDSHEDVGSFAVRAGLDKSRLQPALVLIKEELNRLRRVAVSSVELKRAKDNICGTTTLNLEDPAEYLHYLTTQDLLLNRIETIEQKFAKIRAVTRQDIQRLARRIINWRSGNLALIGPYKQTGEFKKILTS